MKEDTSVGQKIKMQILFILFILWVDDILVHKVSFDLDMILTTLKATEYFLGQFVLFLK